jgi:glycosyltransferase involved in cell wall biosynthesis
MSFSISGVVCTYNRRALLLDAVQSLVDQDLPKADYEILVVDNNSTDGSVEAVHARFAGVANLRVVREEKQGIAFARNTGARACHSPIAAYIDDDALAAPDFLRRYVELYATLDPMPALIGGEMKPIFEGERPSWLSDELLRPLSAALMWGTEAHYLELGGVEWLCEANSAYRVEPLAKVGGFPEHVGRVGDSLMSNENYVNLVLLHSGFPVYYDPNIVVHHRIPPSRLTRSWFRRRQFWGGVSQAAVRDYLAERGIKDKVFRPLNVPCTPAEWVHLFDDRIADEEFPRVLDAIFCMGYMLQTQNLIRGR